MNDEKKKLAVSPSHCPQTPGQTVLTLILLFQAPDSIAIGVPMLK